MKSKVVERILHAPDAPFEPFVWIGYALTQEAKI